MDSKNRNIIIGVVVIAIVGVGLLFIPSILTQSTFLHLEKKMTDSKSVYFTLKGLKDCALYVEFDDDENLMYRIDVELYDTTETMNIRYTELSTEHYVQINQGHTTRAKSVKITLGNGHAYSFGFGYYGDQSENVSALIDFSNATLNDREFSYLFPGTLNFIFGDAVDSLEGSIAPMSIGANNYELDLVEFTVNLPDGMDGFAKFYSQSINVSASGWTMTDSSSNPWSEIWTADGSGDTLLDISSIHADSIVATLIS